MIINTIMAYLTDNGMQKSEKLCFIRKMGKPAGQMAVRPKLSFETIAPYYYTYYTISYLTTLSWLSWKLRVRLYRDTTQSKNYRGITLNNILSKIYSQILLNRLTKWNEEHETISECQVGYQKGKIPYTACFYYMQSLQTF